MGYFDEEIEPDKEELDGSTAEDGIVLGGGLTAGHTDSDKYYGQDPDGIDYLFQ